MQNLDPTGVYTNDEVKEALSGASGVRDWDFRYEHLDANNNFIKNLDVIQKCTIDNNALADIKRTAKFDILDTGSINYLQDRIKPFVRLNMPTRQSYDEYVTDLRPSLRYKIDDPVQTLTARGYNILSVADGTSNSTIDTAYVMAKNKRVSATVAAPSSPTIRPEFWVRVDSDGSLATRYNIERDGSDPNTNPINSKYAIYFSPTIVTTPSLTGLEVVAQYNLDSYFKSNTTSTSSYAFPKVGYYYIRLYGYDKSAKSYVTALDGQRAYDSSVNGLHATVTGGASNEINFNSAGIVKDGGTAIKAITGSQVAFGADRRVITTGNPKGFSVSMWAHQPDAGSSFYATLAPKAYIPTDGSNSFTYCTFSITDSQIFVSYETYTGSVSDKYWYGLYSCNVNYADGKPHLYTASVSAERGLEIFVDGIKLTNGGYGSDARTSLPTVFDAKWDGLDASVYTQAGPNGIYMDEVSAYYNTALTADQIKGLYELGLKNTAPRRPYVEWPQGVFLLSSPTRSMKEGNEVVRSVEAYDQLLALKEESFGARYSVPAGKKYTTAVSELVSKTLSNVGTISIDKAKWVSGFPAYYGNPEVTQADWFTVTPNSVTSPANFSGGVSRGYNSKSQVMPIEGFNVSAQVTPPSGQMAGIYVSVADLSVGNKDQFYIKSDGGLLVAGSQPYDNPNKAQTKYDPVAHAYMRIRESFGTLFFEVSANGTVWSVFYTLPNIYVAGSNVNITFDVETPYSPNTGPYNASFTNINIGAGLAGLDGLTDSPLTLPAAMEWEPGTSKLKAINDLLAAINYESAWFDENGRFISRPYVSPTNRGSEFTYLTDANSVITGDIDQTVDLFQIPNRWTLVVSEPDRPPLTGTYTNSDPSSPTSTVSRGRIIVDFRTEQNAPDQVTLDAQAARLAFEASQVYEKIEFNTGLMPIHSNFDTYVIGIDGLAVMNKYSETAWSMELDAGALMKHSVRRIVNV